MEKNETYSENNNNKNLNEEDENKSKVNNITYKIYYRKGNYYQ